MVLTVLTSLSVRSKKRFIRIIHFQISLSEQSNHNRLNVYFEPQDAKSTSFIKNELFPLFQNASDIAERVSLKLVPFRNAICNTDNQDYGCVCSQGPAECDLMRLMACTLHDYRRHENALDTIACIQGRPSLEDAINNCVKKLLNREADWWVLIWNGKIDRVI
jgi:hypothetical protein